MASETDIGSMLIGFAILMGIVYIVNVWNNKRLRKRRKRR